MSRILTSCQMLSRPIDANNLFSSQIIKVAKAQNNIHPHDTRLKHIHPHDTRLKPNPGVVGSDMLTSAGGTSERPGISIITADQDRTMTTNLRGNDQLRVSPRLAKIFHSQHISPEFGTSPMQSSSKNNRQEASGFDLRAQRMNSTTGFNGFPVSKKHSQWRLEQYKDANLNGNANIEEQISRNASMNDIKAGYPEKPMDLLRRGGLKIFKLKSSSAPVSPNCNCEIDYGVNLSDHLGRICNQSKQTIQAKKGRLRGCKSLSSPAEVISFQKDFTTNATYGYDFEANTTHTDIFLETAVSSKIAASGQSPSSFRRPESVEACNEDHDQDLGDQVMPIHSPGQAERATPTSLSLTNLTSSSVNTVTCSQKQKSNAPFLRCESKNSFQFTALPGSTQSAANVDASANERSQAQALTAAEANNRRKQRNYSTSSKAVKSLLIVVLAFFICMTPFSITKLYKVTSYPDLVSYIVEVKLVISIVIEKDVKVVWFYHPFYKMIAIDLGGNGD